MDLAEAFSHKIAATLERSLVRDLYDLMQLEPLTHFDIDILKKRFLKLEIGRAKPKKVSVAEAMRMLRVKMDQLTDKKIRDELSGTLSNEQLTGLKIRLKAVISRIIGKLEESKHMPLV
jgi:predicted nucleotidyltransferase component of viral defense system